MGLGQQQVREGVLREEVAGPWDCLPEAVVAEVPALAEEVGVDQQWGSVADQSQSRLSAGNTAASTSAVVVAAVALLASWQILPVFQEAIVATDCTF